MAKTIHTVVLANGTKVIRETASRKYEYVILVEHTKAELDRRLSDIDLSIAKAQTKLARWAPSATLDSDKAAYAAAKEARAYLEEILPAHEHTLSDGRKYMASHPRWLCDDGAAGRNALDRVDGAVRATAQGKIDDLEYEIVQLRRERDRTVERYVVGAQYVHGWSGSAGNAQKAVKSVLSYQPMNKVWASTNFETRERAVRAKASVKPGANGPTPLEREVLALVTKEPQKFDVIRNACGARRWSNVSKALQSLVARGLVVRSDCPNERAIDASSYALKEQD
jgi:hypothetical protein